MNTKFKIIVTVLLLLLLIILYKQYVYDDNKDVEYEKMLLKISGLYKKEYAHKKEILSKLHDNHSYKYIMIGDSITAGTNWNKLLKRDDILNMGQSLDQTFIKISNKEYGLIKRLNGLDSLYKKAFVMIGVNDFNAGKKPLDVFNIYTQILDQIIDNEIEPIVQSTLYISKNDYVNYRIINSKIKIFNQLLKNYCDLNDILFVDLNSVLSKNEKLIDKYSYDGIHLNDDGYNIWKKKIEKYFMKEQNR